MIEKANSAVSVRKIASWVGKKPARFAQMVEVIAKASPRAQIRAAWPMSYCIEKHPALIIPHFGKLVALLVSPGTHPSTTRSIVRSLQFVKVPPAYQGKVADRCFNLLADPAVAPAIRIFSMTVLENLAMQNKDLMRELCLILEDQLPFGSTGFINRGRKILKRLGSGVQSR